MENIDALLGLGIGLVLGIIGDEGALHLVRVQSTRLGTVSLGDLLLVGIRADFKEV